MIPTRTGLFSMASMASAVFLLLARARLASMCQLVIFFSLLASVVNSFDDETLRTNYNIEVLLIVLTVLPAVAAFLMELELPEPIAEWLESKLVKKRLAWLSLQPQTF